MAALPTSIDLALDLLQGGDVVAVPTETVYGLAADAENELAVRRVFAIKGRPVDHPVIVHVADATAAATWTADFHADAQRLAAAFWPGPLTMILPRGPRAAPAVTGGLTTIGLRVPDHPITRELLTRFGGGLAAPSANRFGRVSPTTAQHVRDEFGEASPLVIDGGPCRVGIESTIVDLSGAAPAVLRLGEITSERLAVALGRPLARVGAGAPRVSGSLPSHYAPSAGVELAPPDQAWETARRRADEGAKTGIIAWPSLIPAELKNVTHIKIAEDPAAFARELYAALRQCDAQGIELAVVATPPDAGIGAAALDRLRKAAAPRG